jgi:hypothetical protein
MFNQQWIYPATKVELTNAKGDCKSIKIGISPTMRLSSKEWGVARDTLEPHNNNGESTNSNGD